MPLSTDVNLPKSHPARFPDRCIVCGTDSPGSTMRVLTNSIGWWTWLFWFFGKPFCVRVPACNGCGRRLHLVRIFAFLIMVAIAYLSVKIFWPLVPADIPRAIRKLIFLGLFFLCASPILILQVFFPPPFDITAYKDSVDYEFRDEELAFEFAELNEDADWVKIS